MEEQREEVRAAYQELPVNTTLLSQSSYVISRLGHEQLKERAI